MNNLHELELEIGYKFSNQELLIESLTHQSYANETLSYSYERLEFLGDAVIELVVSDYIYDKFKFDAGVLTKLRAALVSTENLGIISKQLGLESLVLKSKSLSQLGKKNIADLFESITGAIYIDGGIERAKEFVIKYVIKDMDNVRYILKNSIDYKSKFQEYMQSQSQTFEYKVIASTGLDHEKKHTVGLWIEGEKIVEFTANSIQLAEEKCAEYYIKNHTKLSTEF